jgi:hypothetical protein
MFKARLQLRLVKGLVCFGTRARALIRRRRAVNIGRVIDDHVVYAYHDDGESLWLI